MNCKNCGKKVFAKEICQCGERTPNVHGFWVGFNSVLCMVLTILSVILLIASISFNNILNRDLLTESVEDLDFGSIQIRDDGETISLDEYILDEYIDDERITAENVDNVLNKPFIKNFITDKLDGYKEYCLNKGELVYVTSDEIVNLIDENQDELYEEASLRFLDPDKEELRDNLSFLDELNRDMKEHISGGFGAASIITLFSLIFSVFLGALLVVILIQWLVVYAKNSRRAGKVLRKYGLSIMITAAVIILLSVFVPVIIDFVLPCGELVSELVSSSKWVFVIVSAIIAVYGGIIFAVSIPMLRGLKQNQQVEVALETISASSAPVNVPAPVEEASAEEKNICPSCQHENKAKASFCSRCGTKLKD